MFSKQKNKPQGRIDSLVGAGTTVQGDVSFSGGLRVDGEIRGNVRATGDQAGTLVVSEQARIEGEIHVSHCVINGTVVGPVHASEFLELQAGARVTGDVHYASVEMHMGAVVEGRLVHMSGAVRSLKLATSN